MLRSNVLSPFILNDHFHEVSLFILFFIFVAGVSFGSFLHALSIRILNNKSLLHGRSQCDKCHKELFWWHLIPILSYLYLKGRCYFCYSKINIQNLISELLLGVLFVLYFIQFDTENFIFYSILSSLLLICFITDWSSMQLHFPVMFLIMIVGILFNISLNFHSISFGLKFSFIGILSGWFLIFSINQIYLFFRKTNGFGEGDKWLLASIGSFFGLEQMIHIFIYASITSAIWGLLIINIINMSSIKTKLPFGAFLCFVSFFMPIIIIYT